MSLQAQEVQQLTVTGLAHRCDEETDLFFRRLVYDPQFCFELFRLAFIDRDECAWELLYRQYQPLVAGWVKKHSAFEACGEEAGYFVNRAFEKMWTAVSPEKFAEFPNLESLLRYLQMCVNSAILDWVRRKEHKTAETYYDSILPGDRPSEPGVESLAFDRLQREELWQVVNARLHNERERQTIYGSYVLGLKPRELVRFYQNDFTNVNEIYRIKENVLARFRRDSDIGQLDQ